jgi:hypothetical protein
VHNSGINEEKSKVLVGHDMDGEVPADIDEMKVKLLQRRRTKFQTGGDYYDESDESGENEQIDSLTEEEIEYLIALLSGGEIQEEDAELVLALMRDAGADINDYLPSLINEFPGLTKRLYYFCLDYYDKSALADAISSVMLREAQSLLNSSCFGLPKLQKIFSSRIPRRATYSFHSTTMKLQQSSARQKFLRSQRCDSECPICERNNYE